MTVSVSVSARGLAGIRGSDSDSGSEDKEIKKLGNFVFGRNSRKDSSFGLLEFGIWDLFGIWCLGFGI